MTLVGGSLGLTDVFGVADSTITKARLEADIRVVEDYIQRYAGLIAATEQQLRWDVDRYANLPPPPDLMPLPDSSSPKNASLGVVAISLCVADLSTCDSQFKYFSHQSSPEYTGFALGCLMWFVGLIVLFALPVALAWAAFAGLVEVASYIVSFPKRTFVNQRNAKLLERHRTAVDVALSEAAATKLAEDHRLRLRMRAAEGLRKTLIAKHRELLRLKAAL